MECDDLKEKKYKEQNGICAGCDKPMRKDEYLHLSHQLPQRRWLKVKYGEDVIHHPINMKLTHANDLCNQRVQMSPNKTGLVEVHVATIRKAISEENEMMQEIFDRR